MGCTVRMDFEGDQWTFFKPFARGPRAAVRARRARDAALPAAARADGRADRPGPNDDRRAGLLVPARHRGHEPIAPNTSRARSSRRRSIRAASGCATSTRPASTSSPARTTAASFASVREFSEDVLPPYTELVRFDAGPGLHGAELRDAARTLLRGHLASPSGRQPVRCASARSSSVTCRACWRVTRATITPTRSRPCGWPGRRSRSAASHARVADRRCRRRRRAGALARSSRAARSCRSGSRAGGRSSPSRRCRALGGGLGSRRWTRLDDTVA